MMYTKQDQLHKKEEVDTRELDKLWSQAVRKKAQCEYCGKRSNVLFDAHHIISRRNKRLRYDLNNGCCLCHECHMNIAHGQPLLLQAKLIEDRGQAWWDRLEELSHVS